jgi:hypothetical protein
MTVYTGKDISKIMMKDPTYGAIENVTSEVMLVETNGSIVKTSHIYTIPHTGEWGFTFGSMGATNGKTAVFTSRMRSSGQTDSFRADTFTFSGGSIFDTAYSINPSGISHLHIVNISSYGSFDQTDFELNDTIPLIFGLNDVIAEGLCGSTALQFRPIVNHTYDSLELLMYTLSESVSCIDNWVVYNVTGLDEYVRDIGLAEARAINYSGIASNDIRLVFKICSEGICKLGKWPSGVYKCYANANITYPTTGNVSRSGSTINAQLSLVDNFNNCSLTSYTANVYLDSEFVGTKTNANSSIAVPVPDNEVLYVIEAEALSFPAYYLAGTNSSVEFMMIEPPEPPAFVPEYGADDIFPQVIDVIAGIGAELSEGSVILGGILVLGVAVAIVAFKPFKLK